MKRATGLTILLMAGGLICLLLAQYSGNAVRGGEDKTVRFSLNGIFKGVCWTGERQRLPKDAIDTVRSFGVEWISQTPFGWMRSPDSPEVHFNPDRGWWGETAEGIRTTTRLAHQKGIKVMLKPHLWIIRPSENGWRDVVGFESEAEWLQWEKGYTRFIMYYAQLAEQEKIRIFCIGTEFTRSLLTRPRYWRMLIRKIRAVYSGQLTYAANWYKEFQETEIWSDLDYIGIQCYFPLTEKENPTIDQLITGWQPHISVIEAVSRKFTKPVILAEVGYTNAKGAAIKPWLWSQDIPQSQLNNKVQATAYEALFRVFGGRKWLAGIFIWKWRPSHDRVRPERIDFSPQNKPAGDVLRKWYHQTRKNKETEQASIKSANL